MNFSPSWEDTLCALIKLDKEVSPPAKASQQFCRALPLPRPAKFLCAWGVGAVDVSKERERDRE